MSQYSANGPSEQRRLREAASWYVRHECEVELSPEDWREWDKWSSDPANSARYDEYFLLHRQLSALSRPTLPSEAELKADRPARVLRGSLFPFAATRFAIARPVWLGAAVALAASVFLAWLMTPSPRATQLTTAASANPKQVEGDLFSEVKLMNLRASGRPVLVNLRADWCGTCVTNERTALSRESVRLMMERKDVAYLKGEWSGEDATTLASLGRFGRQGVPLYLLYCPGVEEPQVLPQVLTEDIVLSALARLPDAG